MLTTQTVRRSARLALSSEICSSPRPIKRRKLSKTAPAAVETSSTEASGVVRVQDEINVKIESHSAPIASIQEKGRKKKSTEEPNPADYPRVSNHWKFGAHVSAAGGVENAIVNAAEIGANAFALFLKSQRKWSSSDISEDSVSLFKSRLKSFGYDPYHIIPHGNYLINLANPDDEKRLKSYECFLDDLQRCELLGLKLYNFHPGSTVGQGSKEQCISFIAECLNKAHKATKSIITVIENMAGAGNVIGSNFAELASIIEQVENKERVGVCLDTCHAFAAGYDLRTREGYESTIAEFDSVVGLHYLRAMHLNDSKMPLGSNRDRHENIGLGHLTLSTFAHIARDPRLKNIPLIMETPRSSSMDPNGESSNVWRAELDVLNRLSSESETGYERRNTQEHQKYPENGSADTGTDSKLPFVWRDMTRRIEETVGRVAVINGGEMETAKTTAKRAGKMKDKKKRKNESNSIDDEGVEQCCC